MRITAWRPLNSRGFSKTFFAPPPLTKGWFDWFYKGPSNWDYYVNMNISR